MTDDKRKKRRRRRKPKQYQGPLPKRRDSSKGMGGYRNPDPPDSAPYPQYFADVEHYVDVDEILDQAAAGGSAFVGSGYEMSAQTLGELLDNLRRSDPEIDGAHVCITCFDEDCDAGFRTIWEGTGIPDHLEDEGDDH